MIFTNDFNEYYKSISDENFTEKDRENALCLWNLLFTVEPFTDEEKYVIDVMENELGVGMEIDELIQYSKEHNHMTQEVCDKLMDYLNYIWEDPLNGFLLDMIIEYFTEL